MKFQATIAASAALVLALAQAAPSFAQTPAAPPAPTILGPAIPGLCAFSETRAISGSKVGQYYIKRMDTIAQQTNAELTGQRTSIENDAKAVDAQRASLSREQLEQKQLEFQQRGAALQRLSQQRQQEVRLTDAKALDRIGKEMEPLVELAQRERNCSVILNADALFGISTQMDLTPSVVQKLDAKITEFAFDRERLDQQLQQGAAAPAQPARAATGAQPARR